MHMAMLVLDKNVLDLPWTQKVQSASNSTWFHPSYPSVSPSSPGRSAYVSHCVSTWLCRNLHQPPANPISDTIGLPGSILLLAHG